MNTKIAIGIYAETEPERLYATVKALRVHTNRAVGLLLLADGPVLPTAATLAELGDIRKIGGEAPVGPAAGFNRLCHATEEDVLVFLESGSLVGPGWLEHLLASLEAKPHHGLAGPSTNRSWNEQAAFPQTPGTIEGIARTAGDAFQRYGSTCRTLEPLYSLADFCYAVRREVINAIGPADESYGLGPCWEMDYNIRAARAGWSGVWACAAYVHRLPFTARRREREARLFEANKQRYQDKFCGARLRGEKVDFRPHCRGDACPNFAPSKLIQIKLPITSAKPMPVRAGTAASGVAVPEPLVSCVMPTYNRREFVLRSIRCFLAQDYPHRELVIVDDGSDGIADLVPDDKRIRYLRLGQKMTLGAKRNYACAQAHGEFIVHWDDDDWYPPWRVRGQLRVLLEQQADVCGSSRLFYFDTQHNQTWENRYGASGPSWVAGNTLAFRKAFWERNKFPEIQVGEDSRFLWSTTPKKVVDLLNPELCVASVHAGNTSRKHIQGAYWHLCPKQRVEALMEGESLDGPVLPEAGAGVALPLVSCIMPTCNRRAFLPMSLRHFRHQTYPRRELIVVDDGDDAVADLVEGCASVRYLRLTQRLSIGAKRNLACQHCAGQIIAHWDDDDWYAPERLAYQVTPILEGRADITGLKGTFTLELPDGQFWTADAELHQRLFVGDVHGGTLVYQRSLIASGVRYPEVNLAEDACFLQAALCQGKRLLRLENRGVFVYVRHGRNAWKQFAPGQFLSPTGWKRISPPPGFPADALDCYRAAWHG